MRRKLWLLMFCVLLALSGSLAVAQGHGHGHGKKHHDDDDGYAYSNHDRDVIRGWYGEQGDNLPPGLAKKDRLPPGLEKQLERRGTLPPGLQKKVRPCPAEFAAASSRLRSHHHRRTYRAYEPEDIRGPRCFPYRAVGIRVAGSSRALSQRLQVENYSQYVALHSIRSIGVVAVLILLVVSVFVSALESLAEEVLVVVRRQIVSVVTVECVLVRKAALIIGIPVVFAVGLTRVEPFPITIVDRLPQ